MESALSRNPIGSGRVKRLPNMCPVEKARVRSNLRTPELIQNLARTGIWYYDTIMQAGPWGQIASYEAMSYCAAIVRAAPPAEIIHLVYNPSRGGMVRSDADE